MSVEAKVDRILEGDLVWVRQHRDEIKSIGTRLGLLEVLMGQQNIRLDRLESDFDGLGNKLRGLARHPIPAGAHWFEFIPIIAFAVENKIAVTVVLGTVATALMWLIRHLG